MLELIKSGLDSSEKLVTLPLKAVREISADSNKSFVEITELAEEIVSIPFRLAQQTLDGLSVEMRYDSEQKKGDVLDKTDTN